LTFEANFKFWFFSRALSGVGPTTAGGKKNIVIFTVWEKWSMARANDHFQKYIHFYDF